MKASLIDFPISQMDILTLHQALLFISSVPSVKELESDRQTWLMSVSDTAELLSIYRKVCLPLNMALYSSERVRRWGGGGETGKD